MIKIFKLEVVRNTFLFIYNMIFSFLLIERKTGKLITEKETNSKKN